MPTFEIREYKCPRCGNTYQDSVRGNFPGKPCKDCTEQKIKVTQLERQLVAQAFSIEQEDEKIALQINELLIKERSGVSERDEQLLTALLEIMIRDESRKKKILKQILKLQKAKR